MRYLLIILNNKLKIFITVFIAGILSILLSLCLPKVFISKAIILPSGFSENMGLLGGLSSITNFTSGLDIYGKETADLMAILSSRTIREKMIDKFNLMEIYHTKYLEDALGILNGHINIFITDEGALSISVSDRTKWFSNAEGDSVSRYRAMSMASYLLEQLDATNRNLKTQKAHFNREFLEGRFHSQSAIIDSLVNEYEDYKQRYNTLNIEEESKQLLQISADIQSQIIANRVELEVLKKNISQDNAKLMSIEQEIRSLENALLQLKNGDIDKVGDFSVFHDFSDVANIAIQDYLLRENLKIQYSIMEFISQQYEDAKLQEAKDTPTIQIIDSPQIPNIKERPKRAYVVIAITFFVFILRCIQLIWVDYLVNLRLSNPVKYNEIAQVLRHFSIKLIHKK